MSFDDQSIHGLGCSCEDRTGQERREGERRGEERRGEERRGEERPAPGPVA